VIDEEGRRIPIIFNHNVEDSDELEVYFPFKVRDTKAGFIADLMKDMGDYINAREAEVIDNQFVAYRFKEPYSENKVFEGFFPLTLRISGYNLIFPLDIGDLS